MSSITKNFLTASLIYLLLGLFAQVVLVLDVWLGFNPLAYTAINAATQLLLLGWLTQVGMALVYQLWLLPAAAKTTLESSEQSKSGGIVFVLFNLGLPLVLLGQPGLAMLGGNLFGAAATLGSLCQLLAGLIFVRELFSLLRVPA